MPISKRTLSLIFYCILFLSIIFIFDDKPVNPNHTTSEQTSLQQTNESSGQIKLEHTTQTVTASLCLPTGFTQTGEICVNDGKLVSIHYTGKLEDGTVFDTSSGKDPLTFIQGAGSVIAGWEKGIDGLTIGTKKTLIIPPELAYGPKGFPGVIPPNATLSFDIEVIDISEPEIVPSVPVAESLVNIDSSQLKKLLFIKTPIIDIRRKDEWIGTGIIEGSITKTLYNADGTLDKDFVPFLMSNGFDKKPFIIICRTGNRSGTAGIGLTKSLGFSKVYNVQGGITDWMKNDLPVVKYK